MNCFLNVFVATSNIPLSTPDHVSNATSPSGSVLHAVPSSRSAPQSPTQSKLDSLRAWSFNTYKFTRQLLSERLGRGTRTVDAELEAQIELLRDTQLKYCNILRLARALTAHFYQVNCFEALSTLTSGFNVLVCVYSVKSYLHVRDVPDIWFRMAGYPAGRFLLSGSGSGPVVPRNRISEPDNGSAQMWPRNVTKLLVCSGLKPFLA